MGVWLFCGQWRANFWPLSRNLCKFSNSFVRKPETPTRYRKQILTQNDHAAPISGSFKVIYSVSQKIHPWHFLTFSPKGWEFLVQIMHAYYTFLSTLDYKFLFNHLQLWRSYASVTTIMCSKCPPSTETHVGWSHLIWHNFVTVGDNWTKKSHSSVHMNV